MVLPFEVQVIGLRIDLPGTGKKLLLNTTLVVDSIDLDRYRDPLLAILREIIRDYQGSNLRKAWDLLVWTVDQDRGRDEARTVARVARETGVGSFRNSILTIHVGSAPLLSELTTFQKDELLRALRTRVEGTFVRELRFRLR